MNDNVCNFCLNNVLTNSLHSYAVLTICLTISLLPPSRGENLNYSQKSLKPENAWTYERVRTNTSMHVLDIKEYRNRYKLK